MLKNCYVNYSPRRSATVIESIGTGQISVEKTFNGETLEVIYLGQGRQALKDAQAKGIEWARNGDPTLETQYAS